MRNLVLALSAVALCVPMRASAQTTRWNDRPTENWTDDAPWVRVYIDGPRGVGYGSPMLIRFQVSDNAYAAVVRVDGEGRMTILYPYSRRQRNAVRGGQLYTVNNPRLHSQVSFYANDRMSGYVFAIASYSPLDLSMFENRDFERIGGWSNFTRVNRSVAFRPDVYVDRFAAAVLWDPSTPYDYDVDYYHPFDYPRTINAYALCGGYRGLFGTRLHNWTVGDWGMMQSPYRNMCMNWYGGMRCLGMISMFSWSGCSMPFTVSNVPRIPGPGGQPADSSEIPNVGVIRGGMLNPTPTPIPVDNDVPPVTRPVRFDEAFGNSDGSDLDGYLSIPERAVRKLKNEEETGRRQRAREATATPASFDRVSRAEKPASTAENDAPPRRETTRVKNSTEPRRDRTPTGFGSDVSRPADAGRNRDRVNRPAEVKPTSTSPAPASVKGTSTTEKKKPPRE
jgi:hypothetical protein